MRWKDEPVRLALRPIADAPFALPDAGDAAGPFVAMEAQARETAWRHAASRHVECGGLLVGEPFAGTGDTIACIHVRVAIPSDEDTADAISLRMEARVWERARAAMRPGERVIGWFHSHPGIGAFFSGTDRRTQAAFFAQPYSLGWVIDPVRDEDAWFVGAAAHDVVKSRVFLHRGPT